MQWRLLAGDDNEWYFQNVATGKYLYIDGLAENGSPVIASENRTGFNIWRDEEDESVYR